MPVSVTDETAILTVLKPLSLSLSNSGVLGGNLRDVPTFLINFRLPWGVLIAYFEIPEMFQPFIKAA